MSNTTSILIYSGGEILGDGILKLPFMAALKKAFPKSEITWLTKDASLYASLLEELSSPFLTRVIDNSGIGASVWDMMKPSPLKTPKPFDIIIDTQKSLKRSLAVKRIPHKKYISLRGDKHVPEHFVDQLMYLVEKASGTPVKDGRYFTVKWPFNKETETAKSLLKGAKNPICLIPGAGNKKKVWPLECYIDLAKYIQQETAFTPVFLLGPQEADWVPVVQKALPKTPILGWKKKNSKWTYTLSLLDVIALAKHFKYVVGNDCGAGHLVATAHKPQISLFGRHTPEKYAPLNPNVRVIDAKDFGGEEMINIPLHTVVQTLTKMIENNNK